MSAFGADDTVMARRIALLVTANQYLGQLLDDPHPGLFTWVQQVAKAIKRINDIVDGRHDQEEPPPSLRAKRGEV